MKSIFRGKGIPGVEITHISRHGLWLLTRDNELFISFKEFPLFRVASAASQIMNIEQPTPSYLRWPDLGIDVAIASIRCFPLMSDKSLPKLRSGRQAKIRTCLPTEK